MDLPIFLRELARCNDKGIYYLKCLDKRTGLKRFELLIMFEEAEREGCIDNFTAKKDEYTNTQVVVEGFSPEDWDVPLSELIPLPTNTTNDNIKANAKDSLPTYSAGDIYFHAAASSRFTGKDIYNHLLGELLAFEKQLVGVLVVAKKIKRNPLEMTEELKEAARIGLISLTLEQNLEPEYYHDVRKFVKVGGGELKFRFEFRSNVYRNKLIQQMNREKMTQLKEGEEDDDAIDAFRMPIGPYPTPEF